MDSKDTKTEGPEQLRYLDPEQVKVTRAEDGTVYATVANELTVISPRFMRARPVTDPDLYISIRGADTNSKEFGLIRKWQRLDPESRKLVQEDLDRRYLHARIRRIFSLRDFGGLQLCTLETDRGTREVTLRDVRDNVIYFGANRVLITDAEGNRYDIPDINALDRRSRILLSRIL